MAYADIDELAGELRVRVTPENTPKLQACLDAAAVEIDHCIDATQPVPPDDPLANRVNVLRGVEWFKANDAAFGAIGSTDTGTLQAPRGGFTPYRKTLVPLKQRWGVA